MKKLPSEQDARVLKTRQRLREAVLSLASSGPIEGISVAELCRLADVNRATFYRHANSPLEILTEVLVEDLDALRGAFIEGVVGHEIALQDLWTVITKRTIQHVKRFREIYEINLSDQSDGVLENLFRQHVQQSMSALFSDAPEILPAISPRNRKFITEAMSASLASSLTAILRSWVASNNASEAAYLEAVLISLPPWIGIQVANDDSKEPALKVKTRGALKNKEKSK